MEHPLPFISDGCRGRSKKYWAALGKKIKHIYIYVLHITKSILIKNDFIAGCKLQLESASDLLAPALTKLFVYYSQL